MKFIDYYKILGIDKSATADQVKKAYRKLTRKYHHNLNPNNKEAEQKITRSALTCSKSNKYFVIFSFNYHFCFLLKIANISYS